MDFNSLGSGNPFYILRQQGDKPILEVGIVKSKTDQQQPYQSAIPNAFVGTNNPPKVTIVATINGKDETFTDILSSAEVAAKGKDTFTGSREAMMQVVDGMIQTSKHALELVDYHKAVKAEGEKMLEVLNPRYAEEKKQAKVISDLEKRQMETDKKLDSILSILTKLDSPTK